MHHHVDLEGSLRIGARFNRSFLASISLLEKLIDILLILVGPAAYRERFFGILGVTSFAVAAGSSAGWRGH